jgi:MFS family permease
MSTTPQPPVIDPSTRIAVASIIASTGLTAIGNGLLFAYIPVRLGMEGFDPAWAGGILTALSAGGLVGCLMTANVVRRVGHARAFMIFSALIVLSNALVGAGTYPVLWMVARALYGLAISGMFIVAQSWLNDVVANHVRGRVMAAFYVTYMVGLGSGSFLMGFLDISAAAAPLLGIGFTALAVLPVGLTVLAPPPPPEAPSLAFAKAWAISPVGIMGMMAVGGLSMMITGFAPIHATASGYGQAQVALLMFAMPIGTVLFQLPFGWISDRTDRRFVLFAASALTALAGVAAGMFDGSAIALMVFIYIVWSGCSESIYSLSSAHANDRADKTELVTLSSTMLFAWSLAGFVFPGIGTILTALYGTQAFMYVAVSISVSFCLFVLWRIRQAEAVPSAETGSFAPYPAQVPPSVELVTPADTQSDGESRSTS